MDVFGNIYVLYERGVIVKYDTGGKRLFDYDDPLTGHITDIDVSNPDKILAFVKDFGKILIMDNTLSPLTMLDLNNSGQRDILAAGFAPDLQYWCFDGFSQKLLKIDNEGQVIISSHPLTDFRDRPISPTLVRASGQKVAVLDNSAGIFFFDDLGIFLFSLEISGIDDIHWDAGMFFYKMNDRFFRYDFMNHESVVIKPVGEDCSLGIIFEAKVRWLCDSLFIYR